MKLRELSLSGRPASEPCETWLIFKGVPYSPCGPAIRRALQDLPVRAMRIVLGAVPAQQLQEAVLGQPSNSRVIAIHAPAAAAAGGAGSAAAGPGSAGHSWSSQGAAGPGLLHLGSWDADLETALDGLEEDGVGSGSPHSFLVTPKLRALVRQLLLYKDMAEGAALAGEQGDERQGEEKELEGGGSGPTPNGKRHTGAALALGCLLSIGSAASTAQIVYLSPDVAKAILQRLQLQLHVNCL